eukprot:11632642-Karenia_brevis.AAC.1
MDHQQGIIAPTIHPSLKIVPPCERLSGWLAANQMLGHSVVRSSNGHGRLDMVGIDKNCPIDRVATR